MMRFRNACTKTVAARGSLWSPALQPNDNDDDDDDESRDACTA